MKPEERVRKAVEIFRTASAGELDAYLKNLKQEDPTAHAVAQVYLLSRRHRFSLVIKRGVPLLPKVGDNPLLRWYLLYSIALSYREMGEMGVAESYLQKAMQAALASGDREAIHRTKMEENIILFQKAHYREACRNFRIYKSSPRSWEPHWADYGLGLCSLARGEFEKAIRHFEEAQRSGGGLLFKLGCRELVGFTWRLLGRFKEAHELLLSVAEGFIQFESAYAAFPVAKALHLSKLKGLKTPSASLVRKALRLSKNGSWGDQAAAQEVEALLASNIQDTADMLYDAAQNYLRSFQYIEGFLAALTAAYFAWMCESQTFVKAAKLLAPLVHVHPGFKRDALLGSFLESIEPLVMRELGERDEKGIKAYLIGTTRVFVGGKEIKLRGWRRKKAVKAFLYLLLAPGHRLPSEHLFYLLWPRRSLNRKTKYYLYNAISTIRRQLGDPSLLTQSGDYYQLERVWTDLGELEEILRLADAVANPTEKEALVEQAREIASKGELLPEFSRDSHIEEYRRYYKGLKKKLGLS